MFSAFELSRLLILHYLIIFRLLSSVVAAVDQEELKFERLTDQIDAIKDRETRNPKRCFSSVAVTVSAEDAAFSFNELFSLRYLAVFSMRDTNARWWLEFHFAEISESLVFAAHFNVHGVFSLLVSGD